MHRGRRDDGAVQAHHVVPTMHHPLWHKTYAYEYAHIRVCTYVRARLPQPAPPELLQVVFELGTQGAVVKEAVVTPIDLGGASRKPHGFMQPASSPPRHWGKQSRGACRGKRSPLSPFGTSKTCRCAIRTQMAQNGTNVWNSVSVQSNNPLRLEGPAQSRQQPRRTSASMLCQN